MQGKSRYGLGFLGLGGTAIAWGWGGAIGTQPPLDSLRLEHLRPPAPIVITVDRRSPGAIHSGDLAMTFTYTPDDLAQENPPPNLHYTLSYGDRRFDFAESAVHFGEIRLEDVDGDRQPEAVVKLTTGGNTCCTKMIVHRWQNSRFTKAESGPFYNGDEVYGDLVDWDHNGIKELNLLDERFLRHFLGEETPRSAARAPSLLLRAEGDRFVDVTRNHPDLLRHRMKILERELLAQKSQFLPPNLLAAYVAQKALLGEFEEGWAFMLQHYDPQDRTGLAIYQGNIQRGEYADFPTALKAFLKETGYI